MNCIVCMTFILLLSPAVKAQGLVSANEVSRVTQTAVRIGTKKVTKINVVEDTDNISIEISGNTVLNYMSVKHQLPQEIVFYFPATTMATGKTDYTIDNDIISTIRTTEVDGQGRSSITIHLKKNWSYQVKRDNRVIQVVFDPEVNEESVDRQQAVLPADNKLLGISPRTLQEKSVIVIQTTQRIEKINQFTLSTPARIVLDLFGVKGQLNKKQTIIPVGSPWVNNIRYLAYPEKVRVVLDTQVENLTTFNVETLEDGLIVRAD